MIRKLNFTGRKRIEQDDLSIKTEKDKKRFEISLKNLDEFRKKYGLSQSNETKIYVEVNNRWSELKQFEFNPPSQVFSLEDFEDIDTIKFRIIVVDEKNKIIASAERIKPTLGEQRESILDTKFEDLGNRIWKLEFESGEEGGPLLYINERIPANLAKNDPSFIVYVYPFVLKEILYYMCFLDNFNIEEPEEEWHEEWIKFIQFIYPQAIDKAKEYNWRDKEENKEEKLQWIDEIVNKFCEKRKKDWEEFIKKLERSEE